MAASPLIPKAHHHARSNSLPSKPHPLILQCNEQLGRLGASDATTSSSASLSHKLSALQDLHDCVERIVQLSHTQEVLVQERQEKWVDELLDGSLRLLDACSAAKDALLHTKECARELQSIMRRKRGGEMEVTAEVRKYLASRKVGKKAIFKALENLRDAVKKCKFSSINKDNRTMSLVSLLKDVEVVSLSVLESLMNFISGPTQSKPSNWSLVSKLMQNKRIAFTEGDENEFSKVDAALQSFVFHMSSKLDNINHLQNQLDLKYMKSLVTGDMTVSAVFLRVSRYMRFILVEFQRIWPRNLQLLIFSDSVI